MIPATIANCTFAKGVFSHCQIMLLICSPVTPASAVADIEEWILELDEMAAEHANHPEHSAAVARCRAEALEDLATARERAKLGGGAMLQTTVTYRAPGV